MGNKSNLIFLFLMVIGFARAEQVNKITETPESPGSPVTLADIEARIADLKLNPPSHSEITRMSETDINCGKIETATHRYTFRVPQIYQRNFGMSYHGDSIWRSGGIAKKENPCLYELESVSLYFRWPSMRPTPRVGGFLNYYADGVIASLDGIAEKGAKFLDFNPSFIELLKFALTGYDASRSSDSMTDAEALSMGKYMPELGLYYYQYEFYKPPTPGMLKKGLTKPDHIKQDVFWALDKDKNVTTYIVCKYLGAQRLLKDTQCKQTSDVFKFNRATLDITYNGDSVKNWQLIQQSTIKQFEAFITEEILP